MQSFVQYKRLKKAAEFQVARDKTKARGGYRASSQENGDDSRHTPETSSEDSKVDVEKAESDQGPASNDAAPSGRETATEPEDVSIDEKPAHEPAEDVAEEDEEDEDEGDLDLAQRRTISRTSTQRSTGTALGNVLTGIQIRKRTTQEGGSGSVFVVEWEGPNDPQNPHNWSYARRIPCTILIASIGCVVGIASSIDSSALTEAAEEFGVSEVVESMATALFLVGFGCGALFAGPISETVGRNPVYIITLVLYMIFIMASALSPNIGAQLAFRFIAGFFGSTPLTCAGGSISDLWDPMERVFAFPIFANAAFTGPLLGPVMGGYIASSSLISWRWVEWITLIISGLVLGLVLIFQPETYPPILLKWKAKHLREITGDERYKAAIEIRDDSFFSRIMTALYRPFLLTFREPIIILIALYLSMVYIILFTFLDGYNYIFGMIHHTSQGVTGLCFLGIVVGLFGASCLVPLIYKWAKRDLAKIKAEGGDRLPPEFRLWYAMLGGSFAIPISLFWMGWTSDPNISIWSPLAASTLFGYGILCVFITR